MKKTRLKQEMDANGITSVSDLAKQARVGRAYLSHLVNGRKENPSKRIAERLANALYTRPEVLFPHIYER